MTIHSAVQFSTPQRIHIALMVKDVTESIAFYRVLFGTEPTKIKDDYAKFEVESPPVNLALNQVASPQPLHPDMHFGIQVKSTDEVVTAIERYQTKNLPTRVEERTTCCYAVQDKVWVTDPDGHPWEVFVVTDADSEVHTIPSSEPAADEGCCAPKSEDVSPAENAPVTETPCCS